MHYSRGGIGSRKHGVSGTPGKNARYKAASLQEAREEEKHKRKQPKLEANSVKELLNKKK